MKRKLAMMLLMAMVTIGAWAQSAINGTVVSADDGLPVIGASVKVKGTNAGTVTNLDGGFTLNVPASAKQLEVSYIGMKTAVVNIKNNMRVTLQTADGLLEEVVVTALGITRSEKTLGYSATTVKAEELTGAHTSNVADALSGKVAGVQVSATSSSPGAVSNIVIRGFSSINGSNQPLYVIDGVPMQQSTLSSQGNNLATGGISNVASDDIESMTILKGAAATALYGSRAANGVVIVTTKSGKAAGARNFSIEYNGSVQARRVSTIPDMQNDFGQGWNGNQTFIENGSWGPAFDGTNQVFGPIWNGQQLFHKYDAKKNNLKDFFDTGVSQSHNIALSGVSNDKKMTYYLSYGYTSDDGIMPTDKDKYERNTIAARGSFEATKWLKLSSSLNFARTSTDAVGTYQGTSVIDGLFEMPRDMSIVDMKNTSSAFNTPEAYYTPYGITNPYWALENNYNHNDSKQIYGKIQMDIKPIDQLTLTYRYGFDYTDYDYKMGFPQIALDDALIEEDYGYAPSNMNQAGWVAAGYARRNEQNHDFLANFADKYLDNRLDVNVNVGLNINQREATSIGTEADDLTFHTGFWDLSNGSSWTTMSESQSKRRLVGLFGDVTLGWDDMVYLDLTARNDWSSTLPINNNSFFYPGVTASWIFTKLIPENDILSFGKVRVAYGKTGNDASPYRTAATYSQAWANGYYGSDIAKFPMNGANAFQRSSVAGSNNLRPEMTTEVELGLNMQFFKGRFGFDFAFYNRNTNDQIFTLPVDPATGYSSMVTNFGKVRNTGIELSINATPIKTADWRWDIGFNFAKNKNKVITLPESLEGGKVSIYNFSAGDDAVYMYAEEGRPMGEFYTYLPAYWDGATVDDNGDPVFNYEYNGHMVVDDYGQPLRSAEVMDTGKNMNSDWTGGFTTSLKYKSLTFSAALDIRKGGYMFSRSKNLMQFTGNGIFTTYNNRDPFVIPNSVYEDGTPNNTPINMGDGSYQDYFDKYGAGKCGELYLLDRSFVKLRNVSLSWSLPKKWILPLQLTDVTVTAFCNNVFTWTHKTNRFIDPENTTVSQASYGDLAAQFGELYVNPSCRTFGFNLGIKF